MWLMTCKKLLVIVHLNLQATSDNKKPIRQNAIIVFACRRIYITYFIDTWAKIASLLQDAYVGQLCLAVSAGEMFTEVTLKLVSGRRRPSASVP